MEEIKNEFEEINETEENALVNTEDVKQGQIMTLSEMSKRSSTNVQIYTNIKDKKKLFNLENKVDCLLNDCENEKIRVKGVLLKIYTKPMKNPVIDEETGEILKDTETSMSVVLLDENGKSYATGSKIFGIQLARYIDEFGTDDIEKDGLLIKIVKKEIADSKNKALGFELL